MENTIIETPAAPQKPLAESKTRLAEYVRDDPMRATLVAVALGFLLSLLPVGRVIVALLAAVLHLARPALLILGIVKTAELLKQRKG